MSDDPRLPVPPALPSTDNSPAPRRRAGSVTWAVFADDPAADPLTHGEVDALEDWVNAPEYLGWLDELHSKVDAWESRAQNSEGAGDEVPEAGGHADEAVCHPPPDSEPVPPRLPDFTLRGLQQRLASLGHLTAEPDGRWGPATTAAIAAFQREVGLPETGHPDPDALAALARRLF